MSVASTPPMIANSPNMMSQSPVLCDWATCASGAAFSCSLAGGGAAGAAGSKSSEMELIKAAASAGVACRSPDGSCERSASVDCAGPKPDRLRTALTLYYSQIADTVGAGGGF